MDIEISGRPLHGIFALVGATLLGIRVLAAPCDPQWVPLSNGFFGDGLAVAVTPNGTIYAAQNQPQIGGATEYVLRYDGTVWNSMGGTTGASGVGVFALAAQPNGNLLVGGRFSEVNVQNPPAINSPLLAGWNGTAWTAWPSPFQFFSFSQDVTCFAVAANNTFYLSGNVGYASGNSLIFNGTGRWNGTAWEGFGRYGVGTASALLIAPNGDLICGMNNDYIWDHWDTAFYTPIAGYNYIARWNGTSFLKMGNGFNSRVTALTVASNGDIIAGGDFTTADNLPAKSIARWNGTTWSAMGAGLTGGGFFTNNGNPIVYSLITLANGDIIAGGDFLNAGGVTSPFVARYRNGAWSPMPSPFGVVRSMSTIPGNSTDFLIAGPGVQRWSESTPPSVATQPPLSQDVVAGQPVILTAAPAAGSSNVSYQWKRGSTNIHNGPAGASVGGGTVTGASGTLASPTDGSQVTLKITNSKSSDSGAYSVVFTGTCGSGQSLPCQVTVTTPCTSDFNNDGQVDDADFSIFALSYNLLDCNDPAMPLGCAADLNQDDVVNDADFSIFVVAYNALLCP